MYEIVGDHIIDIYYIEHRRNLAKETYDTYLRNFVLEEKISQIKKTLASTDRVILIEVGMNLSLVCNIRRATDKSHNFIIHVPYCSE